MTSQPRSGTRPHDWSGVPLARTDLGQAMYDRGWQLVDNGVRLDTIAWDADEVLWDWVMSATHTARGIPRFARTRDLSHREFMRLKPGIWELLWGMHHASLEAGHDPYIRIWTAGYQWRLWRIAKDLPGLTDLLGPPASVALGPESLAAHPRVMCRGDTLGALMEMLKPERRSWLDELAPRVRHVLVTRVQKKRGQAGLKIPELAELWGREGFGAVRILVDDAASNGRAFAATGRTAIRPVHPAPRIFGRVPNTVWRDPHRRLASQRGDIVGPLADSLAQVVAEGFPARQIPIHPIGNENHTTLSFTMDIPGHIIEAQWVAPMNALRAALVSPSAQLLSKS